MVNLLMNAMPHLQGLIKNENITIINKSIENVNGFPVETETSINTFCHLQPVNPSEIAKLTSGTLDSNNYYKFYIIDNLAEVLSSVSKTDCVIKWGDKYFKVFSKEYWGLNGWIMVIGTQILGDNNV
ncbi:head closure knob [Campylobacter phage PC22]|nr:hypothetical protein [Campylobacter jejuni]UZV39885.1 head closure knob [Campylobacter phage PC22]WAK44808.1 hypothetical protein GEEDAMGG_00043 [Campylobacter phage PC11]